MRGMWIMVAFMLAGCPPRFVESSAEIDAFLARGNYAYACVAYRSSDDSIREYAARRLAKFPDEKEAADCTCAAVYDAEKGTWDAAVAKGLEGSRRDDLAKCLEPAASDKRVKHRDELVGALGKFMTLAAWNGLEKIAKQQDEDVAVRAAAVRGMQPSHEHTASMLAMLKSEPNETVRAAAARALEDHKGDEVKDALLAASQTDEAAPVRLAAVEVLADGHDKATDAMLCKVMLEDEAPEVRAAAVASFKGTKSKRGVDCLRKRLVTKEEDANVRQTLLDSLAASPRKEASAALCDNIGPFVRMYLRDKMLSKVGGADIVEAQNNNHWEASYDCVSKAMGQGGYSCFARNYLAHWFNELGGSAKPPHCPGMSKN